MAGVTGPSIRVAPARPADKEAWLRLWQAWQSHMSGAVPVDVTDRTWRRAQENGGGLTILIGFTPEGEAVGFATVSLTFFAWTGADIAFLQDLFVLDEARGKGAGDALLRAVYAHADAAGAAQVFWMVDEADEKLHRFYGRNGVRTPYLRYMREPWPW
ncbi:MAG: N-acetyltransferase family protein [Parvibaculaceae bacterium]